MKKLKLNSTAENVESSYKNISKCKTNSNTFNSNINTNTD